MPQLSIQQTFETAVRHHQAGRVADAERIYRQILDRRPEHVDALHNLGVLLLQAGRNDAAADLFRRASTLKLNFPQALNNLGIALINLGKFEEAIAALQRAIGLSPNFTQAHSNLGNALKHKGETDQAIAAYQRAISLNPNLPEIHNNLGSALKDKGLIDASIAEHQRAISLKPDFADAYNNLGTSLKLTGELEQAVAAFHKAIALRPNLAEAHNNLATALRERGDLADAIDSYRHAIALRPDFADACNNLGIALVSHGQIDQAEAAFRQAIALRPSYADGHSNLANILKEQGRLEEAIVAYHRAIHLKPDHAEAHYNLGIALVDAGQHDAGIAMYKLAIALKPNYADAMNNLGNALKDVGQLDEAISVYRRATEIDPSLAQAHSNLIYAMYFQPNENARTIRQEQNRWNQERVEPLRSSIAQYPNDPDRDRRLRIGYVSPDFRDHVVGRNLLPLFQQHDRQQFEIICYAQASRPDAMTSSFQGLADGWRNIAGLSNEKVAEQIRRDRIDILMDLSLHMSENRLLVFARKPAPIQATFAGYPAGTGLRTIDYRLSDPYLDLPDMDESIYSEKTIRLPYSFWCFDPLDCRDITVNSLSAVENGFVTFGCLNTFCKINGAVLSLWAQVMRQLQNSRLILMAPSGGARQRTLDQLSREGIDPNRVDFVPRQSRRTYLQTYHRIDLGLDSFPYNGHTTSLESLWMGVPVVTLAGNDSVSRAGLSQLSNLGLKELVGQTSEQFAHIAVELAKDLPRLAQLRAELRWRMERSPLMDAPKFARGIEAAYRHMWQTWCAATPAPV